MAFKKRNPASAGGAAGSPKNVQLGGFERTEANPHGEKSQGPTACPLFNPRTRDDALRTANELNEAALRCRNAARIHPGATGLTLDRLAGHYARMAADWFSRADALPAGVVLQ